MAYAHPPDLLPWLLGLAMMAAFVVAPLAIVYARSAVSAAAAGRRD